MKTFKKKKNSLLLHGSESNLKPVEFIIIVMTKHEFIMVFTNFKVKSSVLCKVLRAPLHAIRESQPITTIRSHNCCSVHSRGLFKVVYNWTCNMSKWNNKFNSELNFIHSKQQICRKYEIDQMNGLWKTKIPCFIIRWSDHTIGRVLRNCQTSQRASFQNNLEYHIFLNKGFNSL